MSKFQKSAIVAAFLLTMNGIGMGTVHAYTYSGQNVTVNDLNMDANTLILTNRSNVTATNNVNTPPNCDGQCKGGR